MDLASMIEREDFFNLFFPTVEDYYRVVFNKDVSLSFSKRGQKTNLVIKPFLSAATAPLMSPKARSFFHNEWNIRNSIVKRYFAKCYVFLVTRTGEYFSQYRLCMEPQTEVTGDLVIAPNNRSIRIFDYSSNTVGCIIKQGFTDKYFKNQLQFRLNHDYPFVLPMKRWGSNWFIEQIMYGHPLARVSNRRLYDQGIKTAVISMKELANDTLHYEMGDEYVKRLVERLEVQSREAARRKHIATSKPLERIIHNLSKSVLSNKLQIPVVLSHGDLQGGNIWVEDNGRTWVYDWETSGERSIWYDASTLLLSTRRAGGLEKLWKDRKECTVKDAVLANDDRKDYSAEEMDLIARIVILEDIQFYLEDMLELPYDWGNEIFDLFMSRLISMKLGEE